MELLTEEDRCHLFSLWPGATGEVEVRGAWQVDPCGGDRSREVGAEARIDVDDQPAIVAGVVDDVDVARAPVPP
jgi:hypothetical protein